ncbi:hypothetical protein BC2230_60081 [Burkholderia cepacia]
MRCGNDGKLPVRVSAAAGRAGNGGGKAENAVEAARARERGPAGTGCPRGQPARASISDAR